MFRLIRPSTRLAPRLVIQSPQEHRQLLSPHHGRTLFGLGEIAGVIASPAETIRQLNESKEMLEKAREESQLKNEAKRIPKRHTFQQLPGFHGRTEEQKLLRKVLAAGNPQLNVVFGATSVGKTALLRQVLATDDFFVIKFDLRISGFADLRTL
jgi:ATP-dependent Clp protease ATP-binding subunit ClpA